MPDAVINRDLPVGKWKIGITPGYEVENVCLRGLRDRPYPLMRVEKEDFFARTPKDHSGDPIVIQGTPTCYAHDGQTVLIWPSPRHQWKIQIDLNKRKKE